MIPKSLDKQVDDILDTLYEAADVPIINRVYIGRRFMNALARTVDRFVTDYMESEHDPTEAINDLDTRVDELTDKVDRVSQALDEIVHELRDRE